MEISGEKTKLMTNNTSGINTEIKVHKLQVHGFSFNRAQVFEACDRLKLLSIHFDLCVDATGVVCHQLGLLGTYLHAVGCGGFVKTLN